MNCLRYKVLLFASLASSGFSSSDSSTVLRRPMRIENKKPKTQLRRTGLGCQLVRKDVVYDYNDKKINRDLEERYTCKLPLEESSRIGLEYVDLVDTKDILRGQSTNDGKIISGLTSLYLSETTIEDNGTMHLREDSKIRVETKNRNLIAKPTTMGSLKILMIRVVDSTNIGPKDSRKKLRGALYKDESLKTQVEACSYNKLKIEPFRGTTATGKKIKGGVANLQVNYAVALGDQNELDINNAIFQAANSKFGELQSNHDIDLVMFCLPKQAVSGIVNYHYVGTKFTFISSEWCSSTSALMFNVGRTLGLQPSNTLSEKGDTVFYGDKTGMMGGLSKDSSSRCFNAAKNHQLRWYEDQSATSDPLDYQSIIPEFRLNGISDYGENSESALVVLRLEQRSLPQDYFIGFNSASGINAETPVDENKITIVRTEGEGGSYGTSTKLAALYLGQYHILSNFNGMIGRNIAVRFVGLFEENAIVQIVDLESHPEMNLDEYNAAVECLDYKIEVTTDEYPADTYWVISENGGEGRVYGNSPVYKEKLTTTSSIVCLPHRRSETVQFKFQIFDGYGDGLLDGGSYKVFDPSNRLIFEGGADFSSNEHLFDAVVAPLDIRSNTTITKNPIII